MIGLEKIKSAVYNNVLTGLRGVDVNNTFTLEQVEDSIVTQRLELIKEYSKKGLLPAKDLMLTINCLEVTCKDLNSCSACDPDDFGSDDIMQHVEVPQLVNDFGSRSIYYIGSTDKQRSFIVYNNIANLKHKYRRTGRKKPYVWINPAPNENNMTDIFIFNAPLLKTLTITAIFKDVRELERYNCCNTETIYNLSFLERELEDRVTAKFLKYYRQYAILTNSPNDQQIKA